MVTLTEDFDDFFSGDLRVGRFNKDEMNLARVDEDRLHSYRSYHPNDPDPQGFKAWSQILYPDVESKSRRRL